MSEYQPSSIDRMKESILKDYPHLTEDDTFQFACGQHMACFTQCCSDVNIALTPYDIIRMKNRLGISSGEFLDQFCIIPFHKMQRFPVILLKMQDNEKTSCPFVNEQGCTIYADRPWPCRMYPVGLASPKDTDQGEGLFYFLIKEKPCEGFENGRNMTIRAWMEDQDVGVYNEMGEAFKEISLHNLFQKDTGLDPKKMDMLFTVCYDIDKFRRFVFDSSFLKHFDVDEPTIKKIRTDDIALLKFGFQWLKFSLFKEETMKINDQVVLERLKNNVEKAP